MAGGCLPPHGPPRAAGAQLLLHGLQGSLCSVTQSTSYSFYSFLDLGLCRVVSLPYLHSSLCLQLCKLFALLNSVVPEVLLLSLMDSALASSGSLWEAAGIGSVGHRGSFWHLLQEATVVAPTLPALPTQTLKYLTWRSHGNGCAQITLD